MSVRFEINGKAKEQKLESIVSKKGRTISDRVIERNKLSREIVQARKTHHHGGGDST